MNKKPKIKQRHKLSHKQTNLCSITGVNPPRTHGFGVWGGERVVVGVRIDNNLYEAFKPVAKAVFGSVCRPLEAFMATVVSSYQTKNLDNGFGVNPSLTIDIGKLVIERNVRSRRRMVVEEEVETTDVVSFQKCWRCHDSCDVLLKVRYSSGIVKPSCPSCLESDKERGLVKKVFGSIRQSGGVADGY